MSQLRNVKIKLKIPEARHIAALHETADQFRTAANHASKYAWDSDPSLTMVEKHDVEGDIYHPLRERTQLPSNILQKAIHRGVEAVKSGVMRRRNGQHTTRPEFTSWNIVYDERTMTLDLSSATVSLSTVDGRIECDIVVPQDETSPYYEYAKNPDSELRQSNLEFDEKAKQFYLNACFRIPEESDSSFEHRTVLGMSLRCSGSLAVSSTGKKFGSMDELKHIHNELRKRRDSVRSNSNDTKLVRYLHEKEERKLRDYLHEVSNNIIDEAIEKKCSVIVFPTIESIRIHSDCWMNAFISDVFQLVYKIVKYKSENIGIRIKKRDAAHMDRYCSHCEERVENRDNTVSCNNCGKEYNVRYNEARVIAARDIGEQDTVLDGQSSHQVRASNQYALKSGYITTDGDYIKSPNI